MGPFVACGSKLPITLVDHLVPNVADDPVLSIAPVDHLVANVADGVITGCWSCWAPVAAGCTGEV